ncbi:hypothetical protein [Bradyrhizobium sp. 191]|uniref:hypothetical protein n=1 Tax=Bradyrhizobium sp. 191 TaxID=2782659 RepID=UPI001FFF313A|nr:hypothetical protein [Bradyrhizobium sp. 191]UPJ68278.1 hypothetical protein IVB23_13545 [Bradyrhizobium sp. 191]
MTTRGSGQNNLLNTHDTLTVNAAGGLNAESRIHIHAVHDADDRDGARSPVLVDKANAVRAAAWSTEGPQIQRKRKLDVCVFTGAAVSEPSSC